MAKWKWVEPEGCELPNYDGPLETLVDETGREVCDFGYSTDYYPVDGTPPSKEDKALIAAAPELLDACKGLMLLIGIHGDDSIEHPAYLAAEAAIAKAEGK